MKTALLPVLLAAGFFYGCYSSREIQVELVSTELIKIDTIYRYSNNQQQNQQQQLTWRDDQNVEYISYASLESSYFIGARMLMLRRR